MPDARLVGVDTLAPTILAWTQTLPYGALLDEDAWLDVWRAARDALRQLAPTGRASGPMQVETQMLWLLDCWDDEEEGPSLVGEHVMDALRGSVAGPLLPPSAVYVRFELVVDQDVSPTS